MKITSKVAATTLALSVMTHLGQAAPLIVNTVGVYDSTNQSNVVDRTAIGNLSTFTTNVQTAFNSNLGGVINFDGVNNNGVQNITASYGTSLSKTLSITTPLFNNQFSSNIRAISGTENSGTGLFSLDATAGVQTLTYSFGAITGGISGEAVTQLGLTILTRNGGGSPTITVTANYSNATNGAASAAFTPTTNQDQDTFYGFTAPTGFSITGFTVDYGAAGGDLRHGIDDLAFVTSAVPEPSTYALFGMGLVGLIVLRKLRLRNVS